MLVMIILIVLNVKQLFIYIIKDVNKLALIHFMEIKLVPGLVKHVLVIVKLVLMILIALFVQQIITYTTKDVYQLVQQQHLGIKPVTGNVKIVELIVILVLQILSVPYVQLIIIYTIMLVIKIVQLHSMEMVRPKHVKLVHQTVINVNLIQFVLNVV
jgi:hypothetical protein